MACAAVAPATAGAPVLKGLFLAAFAALARVRAELAGTGHGAAQHRGLCRRSGADAGIHTHGQPHGPGLGGRRSPTERSDTQMLDNRCVAPRRDRLGFVVPSLLQAACVFPVAGHSARQSWRTGYHVLDGACASWPCSS